MTGRGAHSTVEPRVARHARVRLDIAVACLLITVAVVAIPALHAVYPSPTARAAVQTTSLLGGLLLAYLLFGRFGRTGRLDDLLLANALSIGVCGNFVLLVLLVGNLQAHGLSAWAPALAQLVSGAGTAVAAFAPARELTVDRASAARRSALIAASVTGLLVVMIVALPGLDWPAAAGVAHPVSLRLFSGPAGVLAVQGFLALASALAAVGFSRKADMEGDEFANLLGLSFALGAFARVNYLLTPSLYTPFVSMGDLFRMSSWMLMLWAAAREIRAHWDGVSAAATLEERRRLARDLHDGLAQELAFIGRRSRRGAGGDPRLAELAAAADRALVESRRAIAALSMPLDERFEVVLARTAEDIAARAGARVEVAVDAAVRVERDHAEALIRIVCEAVQNATRHGRADAIRVEMTGRPQPRLVVRDNGSGFEPDAAGGRRAGFGLVSMGERAAAIGGRLEIRSAPGEGTRVEVQLP